MEKNFYVYIDKKPSGEIFYVGKGNARRVGQKKRNRFHTFIAERHPGWTRDIVFSGTAAECLAEEHRLVSFYGRRNLGTGPLVNLDDGGVGCINRVVYQAERDRLSAAWSGANNPLYNEEKFIWVNLDSGRVEAATMFEMHQMFGGCRAHWTSVSNGSRKSHHGWTLNSTKINVRSAKGKKFLFKNIDGREFFGTSAEFINHAGISAASASRIVQKKAKNKDGWDV